MFVALMVTVGVLVVVRLWRQGPSASALVIPVAAVWAAYQVQSLVSIDATSIAMLGWVSTGLLLALTSQSQGSPVTEIRTWVFAGVTGLVGALLWLPALLASNASQSVVQGSTEQDVYQAISLVEGTALPCEPSVHVGQWMIQVAPAEQTVNAIFAGAEADDRCHGLVNASVDFALQLEQPDRAMAFAEQGVIIDPLNYGQWILLAKAQLAAGDDQVAVKSLQRAVEVSPAAQAEVDELIADLGLPALG